jgi:hypothetical protein
MSTTQDTPGMADMEDRLRAALHARTELVRAEDLAPIAPVVPLRPRWQSPWVLLATAAVVLLVLGAVFRGVTGGPRSDDLAPRPDQQQVEVPQDIGRDWSPDAQTKPVRLDLDGDGRKEKVEFLADPSDPGRMRAQTVLSSTGEEAYGLVETGSRTGVSALGTIDADGDGDQELVLSSNDFMNEVATNITVVVLDLRDGSLVQVTSTDPDLMVGGFVTLSGSETDYYELVRSQAVFVDGHTLVSVRSSDTFARENASRTVLTPETILGNRYEWTLDDDGMLRPGQPSCAVSAPEAPWAPCDAESSTDLPYVTSESTATIGVGEQVALEDGGLGFSARLDAGDPPTLVVDGPTADGDVFAVDVPDPRVHTTSPTDLSSGQGASVLITSGSDPSAMQVVVQPADQAGLMALRPVGDVPLGTGTTDSGSAYRSWLTGAGVLVTVVADDGGSWEAWRWMRVGDQEMAALPWGSICFDDVEDPTTGRAC